MQRRKVIEPPRQARLRGTAWCIVATVLIAASCSGGPIDGDTTVAVDGSEVRMIDRRLDGDDVSPVTVVLLHGTAYDATTWIDNGVVEHLTDRNVGSVAVDLPGYGESEDNDTDPGRFLLDLVDTLDIEHPVIVAPSMSGSFALPAVAQEPTRFAGFVPVAPVGVADFATLPSDAAPTTMIVWGADDEVIDPSEATMLTEKIPNSWIEKIPDAGHAAYQDESESFADLLSSFVAALEPLL